MAEPPSKKVREIVAPFAQQLADLIHGVNELDDDDLATLIESRHEFTGTNCWYFEYWAVQQIAAEAQYVRRTRAAARPL